MSRSSPAPSSGATRWSCRTCEAGTRRPASSMRTATREPTDTTPSNTWHRSRGVTGRWARRVSRIRGPCSGWRRLKRRRTSVASFPRCASRRGGSSSISTARSISPGFRGPQSTSRQRSAGAAACPARARRRTPERRSPARLAPRIATCRSRRCHSSSAWPRSTSTGSITRTMVSTGQFADVEAPARPRRGAGVQLQRLARRGIRSRRRDCQLPGGAREGPDARRRVPRACSSGRGLTVVRRCRSTRVGDRDFGAAAGLDYDGLVLDWCDWHLRGVDRIAREPAVRIFVMGRNRVARRAGLAARRSRRGARSTCGPADGCRRRRRGHQTRRPRSSTTRTTRARTRTSTPGSVRTISAPSARRPTCSRSRPSRSPRISR